jgi:copper transport protein
VLAGRPRVRGARTALLAVLLGVFSLLLSAGPAAAHAALERTDPEGGTVLPSAPTQIALFFNEPVSLQPKGIRVFDAVGTPVTVSPHVVDERADIVFDEDLAQGTYLVSWRVTSSDGHAISGIFDFSVTQTSEIRFTPTDPEPTTALTTALQVANGINYAALLTTTGLALFMAYLVPRSATSMAATRHRLATLSLAAAALALTATVLLIPLLTLWQSAGSLSELTTADAWAGLRSVAVLAPIPMVAVGLGLVILAQRDDLRRLGAPGDASADATLAPTSLLLGGTALALSSLVINGHTRSYGPTWISFPADLLHVSAAAIWLGSLVGLVVATRRSSRALPAEVADTVARFSGIAVETILVLSVAGVIMSLLILDSLSALLESSWGVTLLIKVGLVAMIMGIALLNRYKLMPRVQREPDSAVAWARLRRLLRLEVIAVLLVVMVTGLLVTKTPIIEATAAESRIPAQTLQSQVPLGSGQLTVSVQPVQRGTNTVTFTLTDADGNPLKVPSAPILKTNYQDLGLGPFEQQVTEVRPGTYTATTELDFTGRWLLSFTIRLEKYGIATPEIGVDIP